MGLIIDTPINLKDHAQAIKHAGVNAVIRYEMRPPGGEWKRWQPDEVRAIADAGLQLGIVYEGAGNHAGHFAESVGYADAAYARERAPARGQPDGSAVYFAVDYDASVSDAVNRIGPYFQGVKRAFSGPGPMLRIGAYASGMVTGWLKARNFIDLRWITCSLGFRGSRDAVRNKEYELWQSRCDSKLLGIDADFNVANTEDWGQFTPWDTPAPVHHGGQEGIASWYDDNTNASGRAVNNATDMTAAHLKLPFHTMVKVTRKDDPSRSVHVSIEDRGPAARTGRLIDLRPAPAKVLGMIEEGIIDVIIEEV